MRSHVDSVPVMEPDRKPTLHRVSAGGSPLFGGETTSNGIEADGNNVTRRRGMETAALDDGEGKSLEKGGETEGLFH